MRKRSVMFANNAYKCNGKKVFKRYRKISGKLFKKVERVLTDIRVRIVVVCDDCVKIKYGKQIRKLKRLAKKLYKISLKSKLNALKECNVKKHKPDKRWRSVDYYIDMLKKIKKLPKKKVVC